ncbi:MAG: PqqD family protein [Candidatus Omnitrophica bacterium]|nr:PqqD family protein [Candidatus Omnitrophota bacterium]HOX54850.1 PqqD family protein [Candidatus Omnitrophota bacterium]
MSSSDNPKVSSKIVYREESEGALLFDPDTGAVKILNDTGKFIWANLDGKTNRDSLVAKIKEAFDISDTKKVKEDLDKFLSDLKKLKFI